MDKEDIDCHAPLNNEYYLTQEYPVYGLSSKDLPDPPQKFDNVDVFEGVIRKPWDPDFKGPSSIMGSKSQVYQGLSK